MLSAVLDMITTAHVLLEHFRINESALEGSAIVALKKMRRLSKTIGKFQSKVAVARSGDVSGMFFDYMMGSTFWDFFVFDKIVKMIMEDRDEFMKLYEYIGEIDAEISIASYRQSLLSYCIPTFHKNYEIVIDGINHPLVEASIPNQVKMDANFIITGSNASGKSTYIKAIAINMILGQSINTVLAEKASLPYANVLTSMAVRDDIASGESYYMREINYLKRIVNQLNDEKLTLCLVDEILRGTNTEERIAASIAILEYMYERNCLVIVASHDIEIANALAGKYKNYHFSEVFKEQDIIFDYKLKEGISTSKNAIKLLDYVGFPKGIVEHANQIVEIMA